MKLTDHQQARRWIHARIDRALEPQASARLEEHLWLCPACREYEAECRAFDANLRREFHSYQQSLQAAQPPGSMARATAIQKKMRAKMISRRIQNTTYSIAFALALVVLAGALSLLLSRQVRLTPGVHPGGPAPTYSTALPPATATPSATPAWTEMNPLTDPGQVYNRLMALAQKSLEARQDAAWIHVRRQDVRDGSSGVIQTTFQESWTRPPHSGEACIQSVTWVKDRPEGSIDYQILVTLPDGTTGDLIQLRQGTGETSQVSTAEEGCTFSLETTAAGFLARRIFPAGSAPLIKAPNVLTGVKAWYTTYEGKDVFAVMAEFQGTESIPPASRETRYFDLETGGLLVEQNWLGWADGRPFGEIDNKIETEFLAELPVAVEKAIEQAAAELADYATGRATQPAPPVPASEPEPLSLDELAYTPDQPLTNGERIAQVLAILQERFTARIAQPGWYVLGPATDDNREWMLNYYVLFHRLENSGCESMTYYVKAGQILPQQVERADGRWGLIGPVEGGSLAAEPESRESCQPEKLGMVSLEDEARWFQDILSQRVNATYQAWIEQIDGQRYFVLYSAVQHAQPQPTVMDPATRELAIIQQEEVWKYYHLESGIFAGGASVYYLQNGKILGEAPTPGAGIPSDEAGPYTLTTYQQLPAELSQAFEQALAQLEQLLNP